MHLLAERGFDDEYVWWIVDWCFSLHEMPILLHRVVPRVQYAHTIDLQTHHRCTQDMASRQQHELDTVDYLGLRTEAGKAPVAETRKSTYALVHSKHCNGRCMTKTTSNRRSTQETRETASIQALIESKGKCVW